MTRIRRYYFPILVALMLVPFASWAVEPKIVAGLAAENNAFPFMASIEYSIDDSQFCGGSLISDRKVLTAAHCVTDDYGRLDRTPIHVRLGTNVLNNQSGIKFNVYTVAIHPRYDPTNYDYDVAILTLRTPVTFNDNVNVINLPKACTSLDCLTGLVTPGTMVKAIGWGATKYDGDSSDSLLEIDLPLISNSACQKANQGNGIVITNRMICADGTGQRPVKDTCQGDSGGPIFLYIKQARTGIQTGIVSSGENCAVYPGVYTRIADPSIRAFILRYAGV